MMSSSLGGRSGFSLTAGNGSRSRISWKMTAELSPTERTFCFDGKGDGDYQLAFIVSKNGVPQPAVKFPTNYSRKRNQSCNSVYMVEPSCPTAVRSW